MKNLSLAIAAAMAVASLSCAAIQVEWTGAGDLNNSFGDPANFKKSILPVPGDKVTVPATAPHLHVRNGDAALASQVNFYTSGADARVYWDVTTNSVLGGTLSGTGEFVKMGGNSVLQFENEQPNAYRAHYTVGEGTLKLTSFVGKTAPSYYQPGYCTVSNNATLVLANGDKDVPQYFDWIKSYGMVTNENPSVLMTLWSYYTDKVPTLIAGPLGGKLHLLVSSGEFLIASTNNTFVESTTTKLYPRSYSATDQVVIGIGKFGMRGQPGSSVGSIGEFSYEVGSAALDPVIYRYLGKGETTDKTFVVNIGSGYANRNHYFGIDGGPYGGAIFTGNWQSVDTKIFKIIRLTGTNQVPCQYSGTMSGVVSDGNIHYAPHILKDGIGIWRFNEVLSRSGAYLLGLTGAFSIEEGTLQFDTLGEVGEPCALGTAGDLYDKYVGAYDASKKVDWAYSFGTTNASGMAEKEGTLEFVGTETAFAARRKISLLGNGRLKNSGSAVFSIRGISARAAGEHSITLDGANTMTNAIAEVSDGVAGAHVSVVKEGTGKWWLKGNTTFSGDIVVKAGELNVEANTNKFDWFRFTFRQVYGADESYVMPTEVALYDKDGVRQNKGLSHPAGVPTASTISIRHQIGCDLKPGEIYLAASATNVAYYGANMISYMTSDNAARVPFIGYQGHPSESVAFTWSPVVMRLKSGVNEIASFDICQSSYKVERQVTSYFVEGSQDGLNWQVLNDTPYDPNWELPGVNNWYSDGQAFVAGEVRKISDNKGFAIAGHPEVSSLPNVRSVRVDSGATLRTEYENVGMIRGLKVSASGGGTIDGFKFAASGAVDLVDVPEKGSFHIDLNIVNDGGTKANIADWPVTINGQAEARRSARFTGSGFDILECGLIMLIK